MSAEWAMLVIISRIQYDAISRRESGCIKCYGRKVVGKEPYPWRCESMDSFLASLPKYDRVRIVVDKDKAPRELYERAAETDKYIAAGAPLKCGRVELINYIKEQSVTFEYHRYGSIQRVPDVE